tara:strand:- start:16780 stop:19677 length:2898 start_codon:yes stop_codon:yes gene_type:complete
MAIPTQEIDILLDGIQAEQPSKGSFAQNGFFRRGTFEVRKGFGQVAQLDTSSMKPFSKDINGGYREHLGSYLLFTDFGNHQIVSVFASLINTANTDFGNFVSTTYIASVYDLTSNTRWEEILYRHTSENNRDRYTMADWHGMYESNTDKDYQDVAFSGKNSFFFQEFRDILFFGSEIAGTFVYYPTLFGSNRIKQIDKVNKADWSGNYSESSTISKAVPSPGVFTLGIEYFTDSDFPDPVSLTYFENRLVYASKRELYFSDVGQPTNLSVNNYISLTNSQQNITGIIEHYGNIIIFTPTETWVYRPSVGGLASQGRLDKISDSVGCFDNNSICRRQGKIVWLDRNGIYEMSNNLFIEYISDRIDPFFKDFITNPLTSYFTQQGFSLLTENQPKTTTFFNSSKVNLLYVKDLEILLVNLPDQNMALCQSSNGAWSIWSFDSVAYEKEIFDGLTADTDKVTADDDEITADNYPISQGVIPIVAVQENIKNPWLLFNKGKFTLVGSVDNQTIVDYSLLGGNTPINASITSSSYYILEYGKGGALDRNIDSEDNRLIGGQYDYTPPESNGAIYLEKWERVPEGYIFPGGTEVSLGGFVFLIPIVVVPREDNLTVGVDNFSISFKFDNTHWRPIFSQNQEIDYLLPPERLASTEGYSPKAPINGLSEVQCYNSGGVPDTNGNEIRINWDGASAPSPPASDSWLFHPYQNLTLETRNTLIYIPMGWSGPGDEAISGMGIDFISAELHDTKNTKSETLNPVIWSQWFIPFDIQRRRDNIAQAVDWIYKSDNVALNAPGRLKARGLLIRLLSHGTGNDLLFRNWPLATLNVIVSADRKEYMSQFLDYLGDDIKLLFPSNYFSESNINIRDRFKKISTGDISKKIFANLDITWGDSIDNLAGTLLIDDEDVSELLTSDVLKGKSFTYTLFGFMRNRANRLVFERAAALVKPVSTGRRRKRGQYTSGAPSEVESP